MWSKSNWCERLILIAFSFLVVLLFYNIFVQQVICNSWLIIYSILLTIFTIWITCRDIQFLLEQTKPFKIFSDEALNKYSQVNLLKILIYTLKSFLTVKNSLIESNPKLTASDIHLIANVIERRCVWSWYSQYVSKEFAFPFACKQLLDQMVNKINQVSYNVDTFALYSDSLGVILRHLKEYKRAQRRMAKLGQGKLEEYYRNTHPTSAQRTSLTMCMKGKSTQSHCILLTRTFLKELLPWELWGTPQSHILASILAKRLDSYISTYLSNPEWIKFRLMKIFNPTFIAENFNITNSQIVLPVSPDAKSESAKQSVNDFDSIHNIEPAIPVRVRTDEKLNNENISEPNNEDVAMKTTIECALSNLISSSTAPILQRAEVDDSPSKVLLQVNNNEKTSIKNKSQPINITGSPFLSRKANEINEVKIYDKMLDGSMKTWNSDNDLECVSLGHDLLASIDGDIETRFGRLWEADGVDGSESWSPNPPSTGSSTKTPHSLWFGEDDNVDAESNEDSPPKHNTNHQIPNNNSNSNMVLLNNPSTHSITNFNITNPLSIHNMKELQNISKNTVNQAKHKIGDLQDEAAGVMEGILDFGMAGLRKGLRMTGLQESPTDKFAFNGKSSDGISSLSSTIGAVLSRKNSQCEDYFGHKDKENTLLRGGESVDHGKSNNTQHLIKQQRVTSQDSSYFANLPSKEVAVKEEKEEYIEKELEPASTPHPPIDPVHTGGDSPEYEYEETADFASTIAKLRHLLQQKTSDVTSKSQDDSNIPDSKYTALQQPKPASATQPTNSPIHKVNTAPQTINEGVTTKAEEMVLSPSVESEYGFTILSQHSGELVEAEEALNHKIEQISATSCVPQTNTNNMQRLDKLFTRTVTGVFNTIKTAVGGDSLAEGVCSQPEMTQNMSGRQTVVRAHQHKDDWIFVEGEMEVRSVISKLLMERRGFCVVESDVEAGQDTLEVLSGGLTQADKKGHGNSSTPTSPCVNDDLDESEVLCGCPLYQMCMEMITVVLGGVMQKDAVVKCVNIVVADMMERILQCKLHDFNSWLRQWIMKVFQDLSEESASASSDDKTDPVESHNISVHFDELCEELLAIIPDFLFVLLGKEELSHAIRMLLSSVEHPLINRDVTFNLLDVVLLHFVKASSCHNSFLTPPPSA